MIKMRDAVAWLFTSLGAALLVSSLVLVPSQGVFADGGAHVVHLGTCVAATCNSTCAGKPVTECSDSTNSCSQTTVTGCEPCGCTVDSSGTVSVCKCTGSDAVLN